MHRATAIRDAIETKLQALVSGGQIKSIVKSLTAWPSDYPSVNVKVGTDVPINPNNAFTDWQLTINTDILLQSNSDDLDAEMLAARLEIHKALMSELNLGLPFVKNIEPGEQGQPNVNVEGATDTSYTQLSWIVNYRAPVTDPTV